MPNFDVEAFVTKLDRMGMKLTAVPLADGKLRINRWRMLDACEHTQQIQDLWTTQIGDDQERIDVLAAHLAEAAPRAAGYSVGPNRIRIDLPLKNTPDAAAGPYNAPDSRKTAAPQFGVATQKPSGTQTAMSAATMPAGARIAASQPLRPGLRAATDTPRSEGKQAALDRPHPAGRQDVSDLPGAGGQQKVAGTPPPGGLRNAR